MGREHGVVVVFDVVTAQGIEDAATEVNKFLEGWATEYPIVDWWFPEREVKHVDGNDNADMTLVSRQRLRFLVDAYREGDLDVLSHIVSLLEQQIDEPALEMK